MVSHINGKRILSDVAPFPEIQGITSGSRLPFQGQDMVPYTGKMKQISPNYSSYKSPDYPRPGKNNATFEFS
jgi:hypothetical protein